MKKQLKSMAHTTIKRLALALLVVVSIGLLGILFLKIITGDVPSTSYSISSLRKIPIEEVSAKLKASEAIPYEEGIYNLKRLTENHSVDYIVKHSDPQIGTPIDWKYKFTTNRSQNYRIHSWDMLHETLYSYNNTHQQEYLELSLQVALDWIDNNRASLVNSDDGSFAWYDMAVGKRISRLSYILDQSLRHNIGSKSDHEKLYQSLLDHFEYLKKDKNIIFSNNHGLYQAIGQKVAARRFVPVSEAFKRIGNQASKRLQRMITQQFTDEGVHKEHSPSYHRMVYHTLLSLRGEELIEDSRSTDIITKAGNAFYWMIKPNDRMVSFGDSGGEIIERDPSVYIDKTAQYLRYYATNGVEGTSPDRSIKAFNQSGLAVVKTETSYLAQQAAFHSRTHKHADDLTIAWYDKDQDILIDTGRYGYLGKTDEDSKAFANGFWYADPKRQYAEKTRAHNTVEIDNKDFLRKGRKPVGSMLQSSGEINSKGIYYIDSKTKEFKTIDYNRLLVFKPGEWLLVLDDLSDSKDKRHDYKQWFHFAENLKLKKTNQGFETSVGDESLHIVSINGEGRPRGPIAGQTSPHLQGWYSPVDWVLKPNPAISFEVTDRESAHFSTLFAFGDKVTHKKDSSKGKTNDYSWQINGQNHHVSVDRSGGKTSINYRMGN